MSTAEAQGSEFDAEREVVVGDVRQFLATWQARPDPERTAETLSRMLASAFSGTPNGETVYNLVDNLSAVLQDELAATALVNVLAAAHNNPEQRAAILDETSAKTRDRLAEFIALYGEKAAHALLIQGGDDLGWSSFARYVYREVIADQWLVRIVITLNSGEKVNIRDAPDSIATLAEAILDTLNYLPESVLREQITDARLERLRLAFQRFDAGASKDDQSLVVSAAAPDEPVRARVT